MYSGSDSTESQNINQWPLNPAAYQNTPNEQIDWAALAQQWIIMKEAGPPVPDQIVNPPPLATSNNQKPKNEVLSEGGEAPMEVENEKDDDGPQPQWNDSSLPEGSWSWNQQWSWGNTWSAPTGIPPPSKAPLLPTPIPYNQFSNTTDNATNFAGTTSNDYAGNYWTAAGSKMKTHNKRFNKVNLPTRPPVPSTLPDPVMLDASKRKQLPAWIREGLEKMERDKQKQMEKEREKQEQVEIIEKSKLNEKEAMEIIKRTVKEREKSKFDSDAEDSDHSLDGEKSVAIVEPVILSQDELMMKLRRTMTEILLNVTNQEIRAVCKEEFQRHIRKNKASDLHVSASSGTNVTGKLGLGIYGDSGSSSEEDNNSDQNRNDSDIELKNMIRKKKAEFVKTEREIEDRLSAANKYANNDSRGGTPTAVDDCDSQVDAKGQGIKLKSHQEETSVKVVSKRLKSRRDSTSSFSKSDSDQDKGGRSKERRKSKRSSSSESDYKKSKSKYKRTKRSRSSEKGRIKDKRRSSERKSKVSESGSSKSSSLRSRKSRSKSVDSVKKKKRNVAEKLRQERNSKRSRSRSSSRSRGSRSCNKRRRSVSRSSIKSEKKRKSRSRTRSGYSDVKTDRVSSRSRRSRSHNRRSRTPDRSSWRRSKSPSPPNRRRRRSWSNESGRGNRRRH